uniref:Uncharacterized protein n=1 Tax=uncultured Armatimonadetes bacterium TaxID=157466 RepID=A0A6J4HWX9_9BACT|nr:hypothetical protein AVDCRST_MAG63-1175 [uncultured Armatimonadetes bacterium]
MVFPVLSPLHDAARRGDVEAVRGLLDAGAIIDAPSPPEPFNNQGGDTALMLAAFEGHAPVVRLLLDRGADPKATNNRGQTAMNRAVLRGRADMVALLSDYGERITSVEAAKLGDMDTLFSLLDQGADVNAQDTIGRTAFFWVAWFHDVKTARRLLERGADIHHRDGGGWTPLMAAASGGPPGDDRTEMIRFLLEHGADARQADSFGDTAFSKALRTVQFRPEHASVVTLLEAAHAAEFALLAAVEAGDAVEAEHLLRQGADANFKTQGRRPLLIVAVWRNRSDLVRLLLDHGATPAASDRIANAHLWAAHLGYGDVLYLLVERDRNAQRLVQALGEAVSNYKEHLLPRLWDLVEDLGVAPERLRYALITAAKRGDTATSAWARERLRALPPAPVLW